MMRFLRDLRETLRIVRHRRNKRGVLVELDYAVPARRRMPMILMSSSSVEDFKYAKEWVTAFQRGMQERENLDRMTMTWRELQSRRSTKGTNR